MPLMRDISLFLLANLLGYFASALTFHAVLISGLIEDTEKLTSSGVLPSVYFGPTMMVWIISAILSIGFFLMKSKWRFVLLGLPAFLPFFYGFSVLLRLSAAL